MISRRHNRLYLLAFLVLGLVLPAARALLNIDGTRNQVFVFGSVSFGYNSNIFSEATERGDYHVSANAGVELKRRAGIIAVNATFKVDYQRFDKFTDENSLNPNLRIEFAKTTGRTTGSLTVNAFRESRSDSAVNLRTNSWNFPLGLSLKYPVNDRYYFTSTTGYLQRRYNDNTTLADLTDISEGIDLFYVYTSKLDLVGGYRVRVTTTSSGNDSTDHWFNLGATGGLFAKLNGTVRLGYQLRRATGVVAENYTHLNALTGLSWPITRKLTLSGQLSRDFNTIATGASVDSTAASLRATFAYNRKLEMESGVTWGRNDFLGRNQPARTDDFFTWDVTARYRLNEHLNAGVGYSWFRNWSTFGIADFDRQSFTFDVASRY